ncbi:VOC family protein [Inquilinus limosus]|uniref:Bleomycin resistance family protein n=1 Tax=Inquilinus limosus TaxID=171674 RepID=A0A211ZQ97_9PROT|nr:VOC family protein [Inquilinus limosus]OWJ67354.1 bleomycin resistance family protein [Inquilinus limosus]
MPNPENLRKQAKTVLRWHRDRHHPVAEQIRAWLPRFAQLTDAEVLARPFTLADAQELVARREGFDSWQALVRGLDATPGPALGSQGRPVLGPAEPQLLVADIRAACDFYVGTFGFTVVFAYGEPPFYAQVARDRARLNLRWVQGPVFAPGFREREADVLAATVTVDDPKALFLELQAAGAPFHQPLRTEPWGARTFIIRDPDGNLVAFAG